MSERYFKFENPRSRFMIKKDEITFMHITISFPITSLDCSKRGDSKMTLVLHISPIIKEIA